MDQIKIGKFIAKCRKNKNMTQVQLADKLGITDRAISKWERGKGMPDSSIMLDLCKELGITANELLTGEEIEMEKYNEKAEQNLIKMQKEKELADKRLLNGEIIILSLAVFILLSCSFIAYILDINDFVKVLIVIVGIIPIIIGGAFAIRIEQVAGYYECKKCGHKHIPTYNQVLFSIHYGRTRYMKCPHCNERNWQRKVLTK